MAASEALLELILGLKDEASAGLENVTGLLGGMGTVALAGAGIAVGALAGIGAAALNISSDLQQSQNDIQAQLGATAEEADRLGGVVENVFANNWGDSVEDVTDSLITVRQQMKGLTTDGDLENATESALALRDAFGIDVAESTNAANTLMQNFGLTSQEAFDFIAAGQQKGLNASGDFLDTIGEYSVQFRDGGASASQFFSLMESGLQGGMLGTDKAADSFKEFRLRIQDGSVATSDGLALLGINAAELNQQLASGGTTAAEAYEDVLEALAATEDPTVRMQAGAALIGSQFEDLGDSAITNIDLWSTGMSDLAGSTDKLNVQYENFGAMIEGTGRQIMVELAPLGDELMAIGAEYMPIVVEGAKQASAWLKENLPGAIAGTKQAIQDVQPYIEAAGAFLQENLPIALAAAQKAFNDIQPYLQLAGDFLRDNLPIAIETTQRAIAELQPYIEAGAELWQNVLYPALVNTYNFIAAYILPVIIGLADLGFAVLQKSLEALIGLWQNVLDPMLQDFSAWVAEDILPLLDEWGLGFDGISQKLQDLATFFHDLAGGIRDLELPDWLTPGSPTPLEIALGGLRDEFGALADQELPRFQAGLDLTAPEIAPSAGAGGLAAGGAGGNVFYIDRVEIPLPANWTGDIRQLALTLRDELVLIGQQNVTTGLI